MLSKVSVLAFTTILLAGKWGGLLHPDARALQGIWEIVSVERAGVDDPSVVGFTLKFDDDEVHFQGPLDSPKATTLKRLSKRLIVFDSDGAS